MRRILLLCFLVTMLNCGCGGSGTSTPSSAATSAPAASTATSTAAPIVTALAVTPGNPSGFPASSVQLTATATLSNGVTSDVTNSAIWTSSNTAVATVSSNGVVHSLRLGQTTVTASLSAVVNTSVTFTVNTAGSAFTLRDGSPQMTGVAFGNGVYVACGQPQVIYRSSDGVNFTSDTSGLAGITGWNTVTFGNGVFAVGGNGTIATSSDSVTWTPRFSDPNFTVNSIIFANGQFVAIGGGGAKGVATSPDGVTWTEQTTPVPFLTSVTFGNGLYVATESGNNNFITSPNGVTWTEQTLPAGAFGTSVAFDGTKFAALGSEPGGTGTVLCILTSTDGIHFTVTPDTGLVSFQGTLNFGNGTFVLAADDGTLRTSTDLVSFVAQSYSPLTGLSDVAFLNGQFVGVGTDGLVITSPTAAQWTTRRAGSLTAGLQAATFGKGLFVTVGVGGSVETSADGHTWTPQATPFNLGFGQTNGLLNSIVFANGEFVSVGSLGGTTGSIVVSSANGVSWASQDPATGQSQNGVTFGQGLFVSVGTTGSIQTSPDGVSWTLRTSNTVDNLNAVTFMNGASGGLFVAVGNNGRIATSPDGSNWSIRVSGTSKNLFGVTNENGTLVAVGDVGTILTSTDGLNWSPSTSSTQNPLLGAFTGNGLFVTVGNNGTLLTSLDGITWTAVVTHTFFPLTGGAFNNGVFVVVGGGVEFGTNVMLSSP